MLIRNAEINAHHLSADSEARLVDVRLRGGLIEAIGKLRPENNEPALDAAGGCLLPGLHDHHIHLRALAAARRSVPCGPPHVQNAANLRDVLAAKVDQSAAWIRGTGYHPVVAGDIDRHWLDTISHDVPIRIQHRSGRLWILNSAALATLQQLAADNGDAAILSGAVDGRLYDQDALIQRLLARAPDVPEQNRLPILATSQELAAYGITGITDMNPGNDRAAHTQLKHWQSSGELLQRVHLAGMAELHGIADTATLSIGPVKVHLHDHDLPELDALTDLIRGAHEVDRRAAVHVVTEVALVFTLAAFRAAGTLPGDRIEHASVTPDALLDDIAELGLTIVTQPNFIAERGREYLTDVPASDHALLYRCRSFLDRGIRFGLGSDAPFGEPDPWRVMQAAIQRRTSNGLVIGEDERLSPEAALAGFLGNPHAPAETRHLTQDAPADLCLLNVPWSIARKHPDARHVRQTFIAGVPVNLQLRR